MSIARRHAPQRSAFTLVEAVIAIVVLSAGAPMLFWAIREAQAQRADPAMASTATWLCVERIEDITADRNSTTRGYAYLTNANYPAESPVTGFTSFSRTTSITETGPDLATPGVGYKSVTVTVSWTTPQGTPRSVSLVTVLTELQ